MKIIVCIKQVPDTNDVQIDPVTGTLQRAGVESILNPFCEFALEKAVTIKEMYGDVEIITVTMGPSQAETSLRRTLELGADRAYLISDRKFAGSDSFATAHILASFISQYEPDYDIVLCGKQAIDGDTAQVPAELAEFLKLSQINYCNSVNSVSNKELVVSTESDTGYEHIRGALPLLITVSKGHIYRNFPSITDIIEASEKEISTVNASEINYDADTVGVDGSPTKVVKIETPKLHDSCEKLFISENLNDAVNGLLGFIKKEI